MKPITTKTARVTDHNKPRVSLLNNVVNNNNTSRTDAANANKSLNRFSCHCCSDPSHYLYQCSKFLSLQPQDRYQLAKSKHLWVNCLSNRHEFAECKSLKRCLSYNKPHHSFLHFDSNQNGQVSGQNPSTSNHPQSRTIPVNTGNSVNSNSPGVNSSPSSSFVTIQPVGNENTSFCMPVNQAATFSSISPTDQIVILPTALVNVQDGEGRCTVGCVLLDSASR